VRFAQNADDLRAAQRLRFEVFNVELHEGLTDSYKTGLDSDAFYAHCHHLLVIDEGAGEVVGTYRLMTAALGTREQLYTASEFDLAGIPDHVLRHGAEVGRACVAKEHRNGRVLQLLWRGIARYLDWNDKRYVFGCCSIPTLDVAEIAGISLKLGREGHMHPRYLAKVSSELRVSFAETVVAKETIALPPLFTSYLRLGAKVCGGPAADREFCVTDYFVVLDLRDVELALCRQCVGVAESRLDAFLLSAAAACRAAFALLRLLRSAEHVDQQEHDRAEDDERDAD
jgi:putative hemolysin